MKQSIINSDRHVSTTLPKHGPALGSRFFSSPHITPNTYLHLRISVNCRLLFRIDNR